MTGKVEVNTWPFQLKDNKEPCKFKEYLKESILIKIQIEILVRMHDPENVLDLGVIQLEVTH